MLSNTTAQHRRDTAVGTRTRFGRNRLWRPQLLVGAAIAATLVLSGVSETMAVAATPTTAGQSTTTTTTAPKPLKESTAYTVYLKPDLTLLPAGTTVSTVFMTGSDDSNCVRTALSTGFITEPGQYGPFSGCSYEKSYARFRVTIETPAHQKEWTIVQLQQTSSPNIVYIAFDGFCFGDGNLTCSGGSDSVTALSHKGVQVPFTLGPLQNGPPASTFCSGGDETCSFSGTKDVAYGANGVYRIKNNVTGSISCSIGSFGGDPAVGTKKACFTGDFASTRCADGEDGTCDLNTYKDVAYGANGSYRYKFMVTGKVACKEQTFGGDPIYGVKKSCSFGPLNWSRCADQSGTCNYVCASGTQKAPCPDQSSVTVAYGANGKFLYKTNVSTPFTCNEATFGGDPIYGVAKSCWVGRT
jgi:hypothetical protein